MNIFQPIKLNMYLLFQYTVSLQVEETISKNCLIHPSSSNHVQYITMSCYEECCYLAAKTHFLLPIPVTATSDFSHKIGESPSFLLEDNFVNWRVGGRQCNLDPILRALLFYPS